MAERTTVLLVANGAAWEGAALELLGRHPGIVVLKRCVDVDDLLATATAGQAQVAVVGVGAPGLDRPAVDLLLGQGVRPVAVEDGGAGSSDDRVRAARLGISRVVGADLGALVAAVLVDEGPSGEPEDPRVPADPAGEVRGGPPTGRGPAGRVVAVWGPAGAPGRTTLAAAVAAELATRGRRTVLVDADPHGGAVAQQLGILDEVSGLLAAARLASAGQLEERIGSVQRGIDERLSVVTGLPRGERFAEVRAGTVEHLLELARDLGEVVVDTGFSLEDDPGSDYGTRPGRNQLTLGALGVADLVVVVGSADPVGLSRLVRGLVDLRDVVGARPVHVVVNRMRPTLGWSERDIAGMVAGFAGPTGLHFLPDDQPTADRALVAGRTLLEVGDSALTRAVSRLVDALGVTTG